MFDIHLNIDSCNRKNCSFSVQEMYVNLFSWLVRKRLTKKISITKKASQSQKDLIEIVLFHQAKLVEDLFLLLFLIFHRPISSNI